MDSKETLFSLELAVESLRIHSPTAVCRLPAIAFKLLDFPTLLIHHLDPNEAQRIKDAIILDKYGDIPSQLQELKDDKGDFRINKCKSSLFKMNPEILAAGLRNTPLYMMLIDMWPEVPKFFANCTISLQSTMEKVSEDIKQNGINVPSVHGHRASYKLYNLMGSEVGWTILRYRLLSMGASLIPHIPETAVAKRDAESETVDLTVTPKKIKDSDTANDATGPVGYAKIANKKKDIMLEDLELQGHPKTISVAMSTTDDQSSQKQQATQTEKHSKRASHPRKAPSLPPFKPNNDLVINNTHYPPPLFFNIGSEDRAACQRRSVDMTKTGGTEQIHTSKLEYVVETDHPRSKHNINVESSSLSNSEDIAHETEVHYKYPYVDQTGSQSWSLRKTHRTFQMEDSRMEEIDKCKLQSGTSHEILKEHHQFGSQKALICNRCQLEIDPSHSQLPILEALLQELSFLHSSALHQMEQINAASPKIPIQKTKMFTSTKHEIADPNPITPRYEKENVFNSAPKDELKTKCYRHKHRECAKPPKSVPPTKGWLRQQKPVQNPQRGSRLVYAMTHSQKLRLRKNNPNVLKEMELKKLRMQELQREKKRKLKQQKDLPVNTSERDVLTEIAHQYEGEDGELYFQTGHKRSSKFEKEKDATAKNADGNDWSSGLIVPPGQPPIAAPRRTKSSTYVWEVDASCPNAAAENGLISAIESKKQKDSRTEFGHVGDFRHWRESRSSEEPKDISNSEKSARSIAIYLPSASVHGSDSGSGSDGSADTNSQLSSNSHYVYVKQPKAVRIPGLPSDQDVSDNESRSESNIQYSDDFVESDDLGSTGERELAPLKSTLFNSDNSVRSSTSDEFKSGSATTTKSRVYPKTKSPEPRASIKPSNSQPRRLSIPKPKLSSTSPVPVRRSSKTSSASITTMLTPNPPLRDTERSQTPPTPKPRYSLSKSASSFSEASLLQSTVPSSEFKTEDSRKASQIESHDSSFNFGNSGIVSTLSDTF